MVRSPRLLFGMDVLGGERYAQDLLQVNNLFVCMFVNLIVRILTQVIAISSYSFFYRIGLFKHIYVEACVCSHGPYVHQTLTITSSKKVKRQK